ncbi:xanthine dehydrogenase family protein molybdopterin-binding subunit [Pseudonocardia bannensis]|uniref:Xanthine dehydrogenase family protein molybdopterin-binding subunit n=1 Tax=Pseudonocardia bannensis TaxID=630973 RepID=A0A848DHS4_9PSEU|nr:xanthine dehydrogenase family protein molybdopterin-binding subunit [Pseudonocardia bannensis]NMH92230.1 xanthine dehydrogenase family protein molybdopterin-binding subunit [Pseudonocardia bannensis]
MTVIGERIPRSDGQSKVSGEAIYGVDYAEPGMIWGALLRSPVSSGRITRLDTTAAMAMPGVHAVLTAADAPDAYAGWVLRDQRLFAVDRVHFEGQPIAAVAADTLAQARAAAAAIDLEIEPLPAVVDLDHALSPDAPLVHPDWESFVPTAGPDFPRGGNLAAESISDPPGVDEAFARAHRVISDEFVAQRQYQAYIEPKSAVGIFRDGRYTIHTAHQFPYNVRDRVSQFLNVRPSAVRVVGHTIGGGFGAKLDASLEPYAALLSRAVRGLAVKLVNTRTEDLITCPSREGAITRLRSAVDAEGNIIARELEVIADNGAYSGEMPWLASIALHCARGVYRAGPTRVVARLVYTNTTPTGAFRGVNGTYLYHAVERHMDHIAAELGVDRLEYRLRHLFTDGEELLNGQVLDDAGILRQGFEAIEAAAPWAELQAEKRPYRGIGIGAAWWLTNPSAGTAVVKMHEDGTVAVVTAATDNGSGAVSMGVTQVVAERLGIPPADVHIALPDTDVAGFDGGSQGSRTTRIVGKASQIAADEVVEKLKNVAAGLLEAAAEDLEVAEGTVRVKGVPGKSMTLAEVAVTAMNTVGPIQGTGSFVTPFPDFNPGCATGLMLPSFPTPTYHVHLAEVEVDPVTGNVRVLRYLVAQEVGRVISPDGTYGQVMGAVTQGIGYALHESLRIGEDGRYRERTLESYRLPLAGDVPRVEFFPLEHPDPDGPFGAKGVGEGPVLLPAAVIANAVSDAIGKPFNQIPITPEEVLAAIQS